jgi:hypothetical protein
MKVPLPLKYNRCKYDQIKQTNHKDGRFEVAGHNFRPINKMDEMERWRTKANYKSQNCENENMKAYDDRIFWTK